MICPHNEILVGDPCVYEHSEQHQGPAANSLTSFQSFKHLKHSKNHNLQLILKKEEEEKKKNPPSINPFVDYCN